MYKLIRSPINEQVNQVQRLTDMACIPFAPSNIDYETFKSEINLDQAQLEDADGNLMSPEAAKAYVATLP